MEFFFNQNITMMKKMVLLSFLISFFSGIATVRSQELQIREQINYIDSILKANPYRENFLEITYYYSIDITPERELVVHMDFNGPFTSTFKARILDLNNLFVVDTSNEWSSSICWHCKPDGTGKEKTCVYQENLYTNGDKDIVDSEDICVMLPMKSDVRFRLIKAIEELVGKVLE
jgi:hypothetical protein